MDLVVELFRRHNDRNFDYELVAHIAARLNDLEQLETWRAEFGFIPTNALYGAVHSDRIETFEFVLAQVKLDAATAETVFERIGAVGNRALYDHLRSKHSAWVTPNCLDRAISSLAESGRMDFALEVFESLSPRSKVVISSACHIAKGAALHGDSCRFIEFIRLYPYDEDGRNEIAACAARGNRIELIRFQDGTKNSAPKLGLALKSAVDGNAFETLEKLLEIDLVASHRFELNDWIDAILDAVQSKRTTLVPLLMTRVPRYILIRCASFSHSYDEAVMLLKDSLSPKSWQFGPRVRELEFDLYSDIAQDWQMTIWLVIICINDDARSEIRSYGLTSIERLKYLPALPRAIELARELGIDNDNIAFMDRFVRQ